MNKRPGRDLSIEGATWRLVNAWRAQSGQGLGYFLAEAPEDDRRAALDPGVDFESLSEADVLALWAGAAGLTPTERRFSASGEVWLAQASGPVWADGAAAGLTGLRVRCLTAETPVRDFSHLSLRDLGEEELAALVEPSPIEDTEETQAGG